jgi:predicted DNA-binding transcriptional regulator AlpA
MEYLTVEEVCGRFKISRETLRRWEKARWFPQRVRLSQHARGRCGFPKDEVDAWDLACRASRKVAEQGLAHKFG